MMKSARAMNTVLKQYARRAAVQKNVTAANNSNKTIARRWMASAAAAAPAGGSLSGGNLLSQLSKENPHMDVVRYEHKNRKWSYNHVEFYSEALALGLLDTGLVPGDVVLSWLPQHFSESMVIQFACSKAGLVLYQLDPMMAANDPDAAKEALSKALEISKANVLISQEAGNDVNYIRLVEDLIPAIAIFDFTDGMPFVTPDYPHLRFPIHTGFDQDQKWGWLPLKHMLVPSNNLDDKLREAGNVVIDGSTPLLGQFTLDGTGVPTGVDKILTNDEVNDSKILPTYSSILNQEFHDVGGVGVIF